MRLSFLVHPQDEACEFERSLGLARISRLFSDTRRHIRSYFRRRLLTPCQKEPRPTKVPVIPVAHNAGLLWPKNSFMKYPNRLKSKTVTIKILPEINRGLSKIDFLKKLETDIEMHSNQLIEWEK